MGSNPRIQHEGGDRWNCGEKYLVRVLHKKSRRGTGNARVRQDVEEEDRKCIRENGSGKESGSA